MRSLRGALIVSLLLSCGAAVLGAPTAGEGDVTLEARLVRESVKLGEDAILELTLTNRGSEALTVPRLRLAGDSIAVEVTWQGAPRPATVTRLWGEYERVDGQLAFQKRATRTRSLAPGKVHTAVVRFPAVRAGDLTLTAELAAGSAAKKAVRAQAVVLAVQPPRASVRHPTLQFRTTDGPKGSFSVELDGDRAFNTASHVWLLARQGFYDGLKIHRIVPGRLVQGGCPRGDGAGGAGFYLPAENHVARFARGQFGLARGAHANSGSCQWFVAAADGDDTFAQGFALVGKVTRGLETVDALAAADVEPKTDRPVDAPVIKSVRLWGK